MIRLLSMLVCISFLFYSDNGYSQSGSMSLPSIAPTEVHIVNAGDSAVNFSLRPENGEWKNFQIEYKGTETYKCEGTCDEIEFAMRTGQQTVRYVLKSTKRYVIRWNEKARMWDLYEAREPVRSRN